jgi:hypothetical protein
MLRGSDVSGGHAVPEHVGFIGFAVHAPGLLDRHAGRVGSQVN